jgi:hypothetical protein
VFPDASSETLPSELATIGFEAILCIGGTHGGGYGKAIDFVLGRSAWKPAHWLWLEQDRALAGILHKFDQ